MTIPALTGNDGVTFAFNDGDIDEIEVVIDGGLVHEKMASTPPSGAMLYDADGCIKIITVRGKITKADVSRTSSGSTITIDEQRQWLEKQFNGFQSNCVFVSNYSSTYNGSTFTTSRIMKGRLRFTESQELPNALPFELILMVGA